MQGNDVEVNSFQDTVGSSIPVRNIKSRLKLLYK